MNLYVKPGVKLHEFSVILLLSVCTSITENWIKAFLFQLWMIVLLK